MKYSNKNIIVTGASTGIGRELAIAFAKEGANVALLARSAERLNQTKDLIDEFGGKSWVFPINLRKLDEINNCVKLVNNLWNSIHIIIHAAGVWHNGNIVYAGVPLIDTPSEQIDEVLDVGIRAPMHLTKLFLPNLIKNKGAKIICISGTFASGGAGWLHYYISKLALEHFTIGLAQELRQYEIQVNCISPSDTNTEALRKFFPEDAKTALPTTEIANLALYLASPAADNITGQVIVIKNKYA